MEASMTLRNKIKSEISKSTPKPQAVIPRAFALATFPHTKPTSLSFQRKNDFHIITLTANQHYGLPYGALARLLIVYLSTIILDPSNKQPLEIILENSLTPFLEKLAINDITEKNGEAAAVRDQLMRLLSCQISNDLCDQENHVYESEQFNISRSFRLWLFPDKDSGEVALISKIVVTKDFFEALNTNPVYLDFDVLVSLRESTFEMDIYMWLAYRYSRLDIEDFISWQGILQQFDGHVEDDLGSERFKKSFLQAFEKVCTLFPVEILVDEDGVLLMRSFGKN